MESMLDKITECFNEGRPFAAYHKPGSERVEAFFQSDSTLHLDPALEGAGFVFAPFDRGKTVLFDLNNCRRDSVPYKDMVVPANGGEVSIFIDERDEEVKQRHLEEAKQRHLGLVDKAIDQIRTGKASKLVVSRKEVIPATIDLVAGFQRILTEYPRAFTYLWHHPEIGTWMGATPEILLQVEGSKFKTIALAGTMVAEGHKNPKWGQKEREEQQMVTEHIQNELRHIPINVGVTRTVKAGNLLHLRTDLQGDLRSGHSLSEVVTKLHPTAAVCGLPREEARSFILNNEGYDREYYTGFLGELRLPDNSMMDPDKSMSDPDKSMSDPEDRLRSQLFVNLRCARILPQKGLAELFVGGGITSSSQPEIEWEETVAKTLTMKKVLRHQ